MPLTSREHLHLLRAAHFKGPEAVQSWNEWKSMVTVETLGDSSYRVMPLLYHNIHEQVADADPLLQICKGTYKRAWYRNQTLFRQVAPVVKSFEESHIPTLLIKGAPQVLLYYQNHGLRPMDDVDILVPIEKAKKAMELLIQLGWIAWRKEDPEEIIRTRHSVPYYKRSAERIDLHWFTNWYCRRPGVDNDFWRDSIKLDFCGVKTRALRPEDQLLHVIAHGVVGQESTAQWAADSMIIFRKTQTLDWNRFIRQMQKRRMRLQMLEALTFLKDVLKAPVPSGVLEEIKRIPLRSSEKLYGLATDYSWVKVAEPPAPIKEFFKNETIFQKTKPILWKQYIVFYSLCLSSYRETLRDAVHKLLGFFSYVQNYYGLKKAWHTPFFLIARKLGFKGKAFVRVRS